MNRDKTGSSPDTTQSTAARRLSTIARQISPQTNTGRPSETQTTSVQAESRTQKVTGHWIGDKPILPNSQMSRDEHAYLMNTNMNIQHASEEQFQKRAQAFGQTLPVERQLIRETQAGLSDPRSDVFQQSSHMIHTQRADFWLRRAPQRDSGQSSHAASEYQQKVSADLQRAKDTRRQGVVGDKEYDNLMDLMVGGKQGPLTLAQSQMGVEAAAAGHQVLRRQRDAESGNQYSATRVGQTGRKGHPTSSPHGVDLSGDTDSQTRERLGHSVFMGTSGSTSDVVRSHHAATMKVQQELSGSTQFGVTGKSNREVNTATTKLALNWMRSGAPAQNVTRAINTHLNTGSQQRISGGPVDSTQTHTLSEIGGAVEATRQVLAPRPKNDGVSKL